MQRATPLLLVATLFGCAQLDDARMEARFRRMARAAYVTSPGACQGVVHSVDYAAGFETGYYEVASGGDACPPTLPPKKYWRTTYSSPTGQEHVDAWFQGFRDGAAAARSDGAASFGAIRISAEARNGIHHAQNPPRAVLAPNALQAPVRREEEPPISTPLPDANLTLPITPDPTPAPTPKTEQAPKPEAKPAPTRPNRRTPQKSQRELAPAEEEGRNTAAAPPTALRSSSTSDVEDTNAASKRDRVASSTPVLSKSPDRPNGETNAFRLSLPHFQSR